jgi:murein DD-endopeptidase MepM/ murein hydrolase activator NlpD
MNQTRFFLTLRDRLAAVPYFVNRYFTAISLAVLALGIVLVALGPIRALITAITPAPAANPDTHPDNSSLDVLGPGGNMLNMTLVERQLVPYTTIPDRPRRTVVGYTVKPGDTLFGIAYQFNIKPETIFWSNKAELNDDVHLLLPGVTLSILPEDGVYTTADGIQTLDQIVAANNGDTALVVGSKYNELSGYGGSDVPPWGMKIVIPGGHREFAGWPAAVTTVVVTDRQGRQTTVSGLMQGMAGSCAPGIPGAGGTGAWIPPVAPGNYTVTQGFASWHSGIDLAGVIGTTVTAADTGVVVFSGWNDYGYGQLVVLDHGNGWTTYYAHLNSRVVGCGDLVSRGSPIGSIGTTGNSTGPHLHFETRWLNTPDNPARYLGF